ncbi:MAG: purine-nucleoside phosphorylase [Anaerolineales bacterium]
MQPNEYLTIEQIDSVVDKIRERTDVEPRVAMILGSGLGPLAEEVSGGDRFPNQEIEGWPASTVQGHAGELVFGELEDQSVFIMQGRAHYYEGYPMPTIGLPIRVMQRMGVEILIVTNAAGAVNPDFTPGELMILSDHVNLMGMAGMTPLRGPNLEEFGPRFPDMSQAYDRELTSIAEGVCAAENIPCNKGVYVCLAGPSFETPADLRFLHGIGVDAVGMSTVPEVTVAKHGGTRVLGVSGITNKANLYGETITTHEEVLEASAVIVPRMTTLIKGVLQQL